MQFRLLTGKQTTKLHLHENPFLKENLQTPHDLEAVLHHEHSTHTYLQPGERPGGTACRSRQNSRDQFN